MPTPPLPTSSTAATRLPAAGSGFSGTQAQMVFPSDLEQMEYWIRFSPFQYSRANRGTPGPTQGQLLASIFLPVPASLSTGYSANWTQEAQGPLGDVASRLAIGAMNTFKKMKSRPKRAAAHLAAAIKKIPAAAMAEGSPLLGALGLTLDHYLVGSAVSMALGVQRNPHLALLFEGVNLRSHRFTYNFVARSQQEAETLKNIIYVFKLCMHPSFETSLGQGNHLFQYPEEWEIEFAFQNTTFSIQNSVLKDFSVNYHGEGVPAYHADRLPVSITLDLTFTETTVLTKEDIRLGRG